MLAGHPPGQDLALFAYGSLIWNPAFHFAGASWRGSTASTAGSASGPISAAARPSGPA